jgi:hypothetical protein
MVGITSVVNSFNFEKLKFVKILKKLGIVHILTNMFQTLTFQSTNYPTFDSISFGLNNSNMLTFAITNTKQFDDACESSKTFLHHYLMKNY